ncbi:2-keto-4-pentenoate hydratase [Streptomyces tailanensis]|uniref:2-keto-4-pentenoate hydratase n=1 Tax=Streptomyces tailanensis TaxID=2569858 RepID=UPI00122E8FFC|nr:fumarylacetoacetate hydrolase family protein [Streptomyces tailanensis]
MSQTTTPPDTASIIAATERLIGAATSGTPCAPVRDLIGPDDVTAAYAVQNRVIDNRKNAGARVIGRKIGLTSTAVQAQLGVDQPDFGVLLDDMVHPDQATIPIDRFLQPRVEAEVAFVLKHDLADGDLDLERIATAVDYAVAALEICDSRIAGWDIRFADTVADNASVGAFVLGTERHTLAEVTPREVTMTMTVTGQDDSTGTGAACLGGPLLALQWLATKARQLGEPLRAGQVILSGALGPMRPVTAGAEVTTTISGLGTVAVRFSNKGDDQ